MNLLLLLILLALLGFGHQIIFAAKSLLVIVILIGVCVGLALLIRGAIRIVVEDIKADFAARQGGWWRNFTQNRHLKAVAKMRARMDEYNEATRHLR